MKLEDLNPVDQGEYYMINCPVCGEHEAFVYKSEVQKAQKKLGYKIHYFCNRLNKCGAKGTLDEIVETEEKKFEVKPNINSLTEAQKNALQALCSYLRTENVSFSIRGISSEVLTRNDFVYFKPGFQTYMKLKSGTSLQKKFTSKVYADRDILLPIFDFDGQVQRILLRSKDKKPEKKEIQVKVAEEKASEIWNLKALKDPQCKTIFVCEGVYDALSVLEAAKNRSDISAIALSGCGKFKKAILQMQKMKECKNKKIVLCLDNDEAGDREFEVLKKIPKFHAVRFNLKEHKDMNEFLQDDLAGFKKQIILASFKKKEGK